VVSSILITGAGGGSQGATGNRIVRLLAERGRSVRAFVHRSDDRSDRLRELGAEVVQGDLLDRYAVGSAMRGITRAYFTYPVADGLLEATTIFASAAREAGTDMVVNMSQLQNPPDAPSFRNLQHRLADVVFDWAQVGAVHLQAPPFFENIRALVATTVAAQDTMFLPWGSGDAIIPLVGADDVARVAAALLAAGPPDHARAYALVSETPTVNAIARTLGAALERPVRYVEISDEQWITAVEHRVNPHAREHLSDLWRFFRISGLGAGPNGFQVSTTVQELTGTAPQTLQRFVRLHADAFGGVGQRSRQ
jgi:uncharacterized protein YbjT (DUF2867 family)